MPVRVWSQTRTRTGIFFFTRHSNRPEKFYPNPCFGSGYSAGLQYSNTDIYIYLNNSFDRTLSEFLVFDCINKGLSDQNNLKSLRHLVTKFINSFNKEEHKKCWINGFSKCNCMRINRPIIPNIWWNKNLMNLFLYLVFVL